MQQNATGGAESPTFLDTDEAAKFLRLSGRSLERMRIEGSGPRYRQHGRKVFYVMADLLAWSDARVKSSTSEAA
jgi:hypothetical protein